MSSFLIIGDAHLSKGTSLGKTFVGANLNSRILDQLALLDWSLDRALHHHVTDIILTGDVFDDPKPQNSVITLFISWLKKCSISNIKVHIIMGNHDMLRSGNVYNSPLDIVEECEIEGVYVYRHINTCVFDGFGVTFMPFRDRKSFSTNSNSEALDIIKNQLNYELASVPSTYKKIAVGHFAIEGSIPIGDEVDDLANELMCPLTLFEGYDYVWMGHIHKPQVINKSPYIAHIGSMDISDFGEVDQEKKIIIFDTSLDNFFIEEKLPTRNLKKLTLEVPEEEENPTQYVLNMLKQGKEDLNKAIVKVEVCLKNKDKNINKSEIEKYLLSKGSFNVASISETKKNNIVKKESNTLNNKMDISTAIKQYGDLYVEESVRSKFLEVSMEIYRQYQEEEQ